MFWSPLLILLVGGLLDSVRSYVNESYWTIVQNKEPVALEVAEKFVRFGAHPRRHGRKLNGVYPAMLLKDGRLFFGQTAENRTETGGFCASFNKDGELFATCDHFRVFSNFQRNDEFYLLRPEFFDPLLDDPVAFGERQLVIVYDAQSDSSFFGTFEQGVVFALDYEGAPVEISGRSATSGDFLMLVARSRPFFNPYGRICRPVGSELKGSE